MGPLARSLVAEFATDNKGVCGADPMVGLSAGGAGAKASTGASGKSDEGADSIVDCDMGWVASVVAATELEARLAVEPAAELTAKRSAKPAAEAPVEIAAEAATEAAMDGAAEVTFELGEKISVSASTAGSHEAGSSIATP